MAQAIDITDLRLMVARVDKDIKSSPITMGIERLGKLGISVLTDVEYENTFFKRLRRGGNTFAYKHGKDQKKGQLGALVQRDMHTEIIKALIPDNLLAYRDVVPLGEGTRVDLASLTYFPENIKAIQEEFIGDIVRNIFVGKRDEDNHDGYHIMDGLFTEMDKYIQKGEISVALKNMVAMPEITDDMTDLEVYKVMHKWRTLWNENFQEHLDIENGGMGVHWYLSKAIYDRFVEGYKAQYSQQNLTDVHKPGYTFIGWDGITFHPTALMGRGSRMFVTIADNLDLGFNTRQALPGVKITEDELDPTDIYFHIMSAIGTRVRYIEPSCFIMNDQSNTIISGLGMDYEQATVYLSSNDDTLGTVAADKSLTDVAGGTIITLTATATSTGQFKMWQDGCTLAQRTISAPGRPVAYQAIFEAKAGA